MTTNHHAPLRTDRGITKAEDLKGRKIGTPGFSSTSLTWIRGIMEHEYGVKPSDIEWVVSAKDSSADAAGKVSKQENMIPKGLSVSKGPAGKDESQMIVDGDVDALFHAVEPKAFVEGNPIVARPLTRTRVDLTYMFTVERPVTGCPKDSSGSRSRRWECSK